MTASRGRYLVLLSSVGLALILGVGQPLAASAISFSGPERFRTGHRPTSIAVGDLNGDRRPDLATANYAGSLCKQGSREVPPQGRLSSRRPVGCLNTISLQTGQVWTAHEFTYPTRLILVCRLPTMSKAGATASLPTDRRRLASRKGQAPRPGSQKSS